MTESSSESYIDQSILDSMTPEGRNLAERVLASSEHIITVTRGHRPSLFPPRSVPSFSEVVGPEATEEYRRVREDLDEQELRSSIRARVARRLGRNGIE